MTEPTTTGAAAFAASISAFSLALIGIDHYAIVWGLIGALSRLAFTEEQLPAMRAAVTVGASTALAAGLAHGIAALAPTESVRNALIFSAVVIGFGAQAIAKTAVEALLARLKKFGEGS